MSTDTYPHPSGESCPACHGCQTCHRWYHGHHCPCQAWIEEFMPPETAGSAGQDRITTTAAPYDRAVLVDVLVYHYRKDLAGCGCGWAELGRSWPEHVAAVYEESARARA